MTTIERAKTLPPLWNRFVQLPNDTQDLLAVEFTGSVLLGLSQDQPDIVTRDDAADFAMDSFAGLLAKYETLTKRV